MLDKKISVSSSLEIMRLSKPLFQFCHPWGYYCYYFYYGYYYYYLTTTTTPPTLTTDNDDDDEIKTWVIHGHNTGFLKISDAKLVVSNILKQKSCWQRLFRPVKEVEAFSSKMASGTLFCLLWCLFKVFLMFSKNSSHSFEVLEPV